MKNGTMPMSQNAEQASQRNREVISQQLDVIANAIKHFGLHHISQASKNVLVDYTGYDPWQVQRALDNGAYALAWYGDAHALDN